MKLFYQLSKSEQDGALSYCVSIVLNDLLTEGVKLDPTNDDEKILKAKLEMAIDKVKDFPSKEAKIEYIMADEDLAGVIMQIAEEISRTGWYAGNDEMVIFTNELGGDEAEVMDAIADVAKTVNKNELN